MVCPNSKKDIWQPHLSMITILSTVVLLNFTIITVYLPYTDTAAFSLSNFGNKTNVFNLNIINSQQRCRVEWSREKFHRWSLCYISRATISAGHPRDWKATMVSNAITVMITSVYTVATMCSKIIAKTMKEATDRHKWVHKVFFAYIKVYGTRNKTNMPQFQFHRTR
jgi:hypothetical protein